MAEGNSKRTRNIIIGLIVAALIGYMAYTMVTQGVHLEMGDGSH